MNSLSDFCCVCLRKNVDLKNLLEIRFYETTFTALATAIFPELRFPDTDQGLLVCRNCVGYMSELFIFRKTCIRNNQLLMKYIEDLNSVKAYGTGVQTVGASQDELEVDWVNLSEYIREGNEVPLENDPLLDTGGNVGCKMEIEEVSVKSEVSDGESSESNFLPAQISTDVVAVPVPNSPLDESQRQIHECTTCDEALLRTHTRTHKPPAQHKSKCVDCGKMVSDMRKHVRRKHGERPFKCEECTESFAELDALNKHRLCHRTVRPFKCEVCGKRFKKWGHLNMHTKVHTGKDPYVCEKCGDAFRYKQLLRDHLTKVHLTTLVETATVAHERQLICMSCGWKFKLLSSLQYHHAMHLKNKLKCDICGKCFCRNDALSFHTTVHPDKDPFVCEECNQTFNMLCHFKTHQLVHSGKMPEKCQVCEDDIE